MGVKAIADVDIGGEDEFPYFLIHVKLFVINTTRYLVLFTGAKQ